MRKTEECRGGDCLSLTLSEAFKKDFQREVLGLRQRGNGEVYVSVWDIHQRNCINDY